jgi:hypothetical protein
MVLHRAPDGIHPEKHLHVAILLRRTQKGVNQECRSEGDCYHKAFIPWKQRRKRYQKEDDRLPEYKGEGFFYEFETHRIKEQQVTGGQKACAERLRGKISAKHAYGTEQQQHQGRRTPEDEILCKILFHISYGA